MDTLPLARRGDSGRPSGPPAGVPLAEFARTHSVALTQFAYLVCGDRGLAEDLVQEAFTALYRRFGELIPVDAPVAYTRRAIVNGHISATRKRAAVLTPTGQVPDHIGNSVDAVDSGEQDAMWRLLATLPERQRAVLVLRYYVDLSDRDIAQTLDCREGTVRSLAARAFTALRGDTALSLLEDPS